MPTGTIPDLTHRIFTKIIPHLKYYAAELAGLAVPDTVPCSEARDYVDLDNEDWVLVRDAFSENGGFTFHVAHRSCAETAYGKDKVLG